MRARAHGPGPPLSRGCWLEAAGGSGGARGAPPLKRRDDAHRRASAPGSLNLPPSIHTLQAPPPLTSLSLHSRERPPPLSPMYTLLSGLYDLVTAKEEVRLLLIGLDGAG